MKMVTGEDIISDVEEKEDKYILTNPAKIAMVPHNEEGGVGIALIPWLMIFSSHTQEISKNHVLLTDDPDTDLANGYSSQFGSGIVTARDIPDIPNIHI